MIITIDGPTASGKSTVARAIAQRLGWWHINSGLVYRTLAYLLVKQYGYDDQNLVDPGVRDVEQVLATIRYQYASNTGAAIVVGGDDITGSLKTPAVDRAASIVSMNAMVRQEVLCYVRAIAQEHDSVADGRDCGSVLFPDAVLKIFLTASPEERAARWQVDQNNRGASYTLQQALDALVERDARDTQREVDPLRVPEGAVIIDNTGLSLDQTLDRIQGLLITLS